MKREWMDDAWTVLVVLNLKQMLKIEVHIEMDEQVNRTWLFRKNEKFVNDPNVSIWEGVLKYAKFM